VTCNELEKALRDRLVQRLGAIDHPGRPSYPVGSTADQDWSAILDRFPAGVHDCVLVLGNSIAFLTNRAAITSALRCLGELLTDRGVLLVDERNWGKVAGQLDAVNRDPWNAFSFNREETRRSMYYGRGVQGEPRERRWDSFRFEYARLKREQDRWVATEVVGELWMYAVSVSDRRALVSIAESAGLKCQAIWSDLKAGDDPGAEFFTYAFTRAA